MCLLSTQGFSRVEVFHGREGIGESQSPLPRRQTLPCTPGCVIYSFLPSNPMSGSRMVHPNPEVGGEECLLDQPQGTTMGERSTLKCQQVCGGSQGPLRCRHGNVSGFWRRPFSTVHKLYELDNSHNCSVPVFLLLFLFLTFSF